MTTRSQHVRGLFLTTLGVLILTPDSLLIRVIGVDTWTLLFWRGSLQALTIILCYVLYYRGKALAELCRIGSVGVVIAFLYTASNILFIQSIRLTFVANTLIILASSPLLAAMFSWLFLREHVKVRTWVATIIGFGGIVLIFSSGAGGSSLAGDACALGAAAFLAGTFVVIRGAKNVNMIPAVALTGLLTAVVSWPLATPLPVGSTDALLLLLLGAFVSPVSFALITLGPRTLTAPEVSLIMLLETVLGPVWVWLVLSEAPPAGTWIGGVIVLGALLGHSLLALREE